MSLNPILDLKNNDEIHEQKLRPGKLSEFIGQENLKQNLKIFIDSSMKRQDVLDHVLLYGPPGLGKTSLANIIAKELGVGFRSTSGPILAKPGDLASILTNLQENDVLFIDEIHRLSISVEEILYSAMEDYAIDIIIGEGPAARTVKIDLPKFTLVGATTRIGLLSNPLRDRFGIPLRLNYYNIEELDIVVKRGAQILKFNIDDQASLEIASRSRGTPRITLRLLKRLRDFALSFGSDIIDYKIAKSSLDALEVDSKGLDSNDLRYLNFIALNYHGGPVGLDTICSALSEERDTIEDTIEPFLIQLGFIHKTPRGRVLTPAAFLHLGIILNNIEK